MFTNKSKIQLYTYSVDFANPVNFFCKIVDDIGSNIITGFSIENIFNDEFKKKIGYRYTEGVSTIDDLASTVAKYYEQQLFDEINIDKIEVLFIYKAQKLLCCYDSEGKLIRNSITQALKAKNILSQLINEINDLKLKASLQKLKSLSFPELFGNIFSVKDKRDSIIPYLPFDYLDESLIEEDFLDEEDVRINNVKFKEELQVEVPIEKNVLLITGKNKVGDSIELGVKYNGVLFLTTSAEILPFIKDNHYSDFYWLLFKKVYTVLNNRSKIADFKNDILTDFKKHSMDLSMSKMLSSIQNNHFLSANELSKYPKYQSYFEQVSAINGLLGVENFKFYISNAKGRTALGIYATKKVETEFNLLHWTRENETEDKLDHFRNEKPPQSLSLNKTHVLKPEIAFYFLTKYYEDFFEQGLIATGKDYVKNVELYVDDHILGEIDFIIKSGPKLSFVEAKTKLTNIYIEEYILKCEKIIAQLKATNIEVEVDFYIFAAFSDATCENKRYFINESKKKSYNIPNQDFAIIPYYFKVPIPRYKNCNLTCVAEPSFTKLKAILKKI